VRTGYNAIADEWIGIRPGTDGLFVMALIHELIRTDRVDLDYLARYTNAHGWSSAIPAGPTTGSSCATRMASPGVGQHEKAPIDGG
jgi:anaerobic selenocysteine-containing dehydrogenase